MKCDGINMIQVHSIDDAIEKISQCTDREQVKQIVDEVDRRFINAELVVDGDGWAGLSKAVALWIHQNG